MTQKDVQRITLYMSSALKDRVENEAKLRGSTMNAIITGWIAEKLQEGNKMESLEDAIQLIQMKIAEIEKRIQ